jgi:gliding motility-associated-like protein
VAEGTNWQWDFGDGTTSDLENPTHTYATPGTYTVTLTVTYGVANCQTPETEISKVVVAPPLAYNIITPNGDGRNDVFSAVTSNLPLKLRVFSRWGREVYSADNYQQNWAGDDLPAGTYYYLVTASDGQAWKGWLEIVR